MAMRTWHLYRKGDGRFTQSISLQDFEGIEAHIEATTPAEYGAVEHAASIDYESRRFDEEHDCIVDYQPSAPEPSSDYAWNTDSRRWEVRADVAEHRAAIARAQAEIDRLETTQLRAIREAYLHPDDEAARIRVNDIDTAIAEQRRLIREHGAYLQLGP